MNAQDVLMYGHQTVLRAIEGLPDDAWEVPDVCGVWSTKEIVAHLASFEQMLVEVLSAVADPAVPTPTLDAFRSDAGFNDAQVAARRARTAAETVAEYREAHERVRTLAAGVPEATWRTPGTLPWYGAEYALDDYLVYTFYGHKREHCAQIKLFRKRLGR